MNSPPGQRTPDLQTSSFASLRFQHLLSSFSPLVETLASLGSGLDNLCHSRLDPESLIQIIGLILGWPAEFEASIQIFGRFLGWMAVFEASIQVLAPFHGRVRVIACLFVRDRTVRRIAESCRGRDNGCFRPKWYPDRTLRGLADSCRGRDNGCFRPKWYPDRTLRCQAESCRGGTM